MSILGRRWRPGHARKGREKVMLHDPHFYFGWFIGAVFTQIVFWMLERWSR